ncbi:MAG: DEAD/DEAH box helicase, partial [Planctomycetota bacterium]
MQPQLQQQLAKGVFSALIPQLQRAVASEGYVTPTPIQEQCIPHLLQGRDLMGCAQTGTGKTAAFALPLLQRLSDDFRRPRPGTPRALILAPTRELAAQIGESIQTYGRFGPISQTVIFGGVNQSSQVKALKRGIHILVATPGRLLDLMQQGFVHLNEVEVFILDEVDRMLDMG